MQEASGVDHGSAEEPTRRLAEMISTPLTIEDDEYPIDAHGPLVIK